MMSCNNKIIILAIKYNNNNKISINKFIINLENHNRLIRIYSNNNNYNQSQTTISIKIIN